MNKDEIGVKTFYFLTGVMVIIISGMTIGLLKYLGSQYGYMPIANICFVLSCILFVASRFMKK